MCLSKITSWSFTSSRSTFSELQRLGNCPDLKTKNNVLNLNLCFHKELWTLKFSCLFPAVAIVVCSTLPCNVCDIPVKNISNASRHSCCKVSSCWSKNNNSASSHIFATVITTTLKKKSLYIVNKLFIKIQWGKHKMRKAQNEKIRLMAAA